MTLYAKVEGKGTPVLFLHGMIASSVYWESTFALRPDGYQFIALDMLGFGRSPKPKDSSYDYDVQIEAIVATLADLKLSGPLIVVGHSMGSLIALRLAKLHPELVQQLLLVGVPYYPDRATVRRDITHNRKLVELAYYGTTSRVLCTLWCGKLRPVSRFIAPLYLRQMTGKVARDSLMHTWHSYAGSLHHIIEGQAVLTDLAKLTQPITFLYGAGDGCLPYARQQRAIRHYAHGTFIVDADTGHQLPIENPQLVIECLTATP